MVTVDPVSVMIASIGFMALYGAWKLWRNLDGF